MNRRTRSDAAIGALLAGGLAIVAGAVIAVRPDAWLLVVVPAGLLALVASATVRLSFVVVVGTVVLGPAEMNTAKLLYFVGLLAGAVVAGLSLLRCRTALPPQVTRLIRLSMIAALLIGLVAVFRLASGTDPTSVVRDVGPYLLLAVVPVFAVDAATRLSMVRLQTIAALALALGSGAFLMSWTSRRGLVVDEAGAAIFGGFFVPIALLILSASSLWQGSLPRRAMWLALAGLAAATVAVTGTRSFVLASPAVLLTIVMAGPRPSLRTLGRIAIAAISIGVSGVVVTALVVSILGIDLSSVLDRWQLLAAAAGDPLGDQSVVSRLDQTDAAWRLFLASPIFGIRTGLHGAFVATGGEYASDTPLATLAGFGVTGAMAVLALLVGWAGLATRPLDGVSIQRAALIGLVAAAVTYGLILPIVEDKGLAFALLLLGAPAIHVLMAGEANMQRLLGTGQSTATEAMKRGAARVVLAERY